MISLTEMAADPLSQMMTLPYPMGICSGEDKTTA